MQDEIREIEVRIPGGKLMALQAGPGGPDGVLLLHGARFDRNTWRELGTVALLARGGRRVVALDLPGYGGSPEMDPGTPGNPAGVLLSALEELGLERAVVVAPSMSGCYLLPFLEEYPERCAGAISIAPACVDSFAGPFQGPALILWGEQDRVFPVAGATKLLARFSEARVETFPGASHPCYLDDPERFHEHLCDFVERVLGG